MTKIILIGGGIAGISATVGARKARSEVTLMMKQLALHLSSSKIAIVDITPSIPAMINLCYLKKIELSHPAQQFVACLKSQ